MESELELLLGTAIDSLVKVEILLYIQERPEALLTAKDISSRLRRLAREVDRALVELSDVGLIERFALGSGRHVVYGLTEDEHIRGLLNALGERYRSDSESRSRLIQAALGQVGDRSERDDL